MKVDIGLLPLIFPLKLRERVYDAWLEENGNETPRLLWLLHPSLQSMTEN